MRHSFLSRTEWILQITCCFTDMNKLSYIKSLRQHFLNRKEETNQKNMRRLEEEEEDGRKRMQGGNEQEGMEEKRAGKRKGVE